MKTKYNCKIIAILIMIFFTANVHAQINKKKKAKKIDTASIFSKVNKLDEVIIHTRKASVIKQLKQAPVSVEVIDLKPVLHKSGDLVTILNRISGVTIRSDGGIGDELNFSINGLDKKSVVLFKDGVPMSFYGHAFSPGLVSANMFERIEIYKGVLPIAFGADALGGGINFVTRQPKKSYVDTSFETGSYATVRNSVTMFFPNKNNTFYGGGNLGYTASDNNWKVEVKEADENFTSTTATHKDTDWYPLKNNAANIFTGEFFIGVKNKSWVDDMRISFITSNFYKRINHIPGTGDTRNAAAKSLFTYGEDKSNAGVFTYRKSFFNKKLKIDIMAGLSKSTTRLVDTTNANVNSFGEITSFKYNPKPVPGVTQIHAELAPNGIYSNLNYTLKAIRFNANYNVLKNHQLQFNHIYTSNYRIGTDPIGGIVKSLQTDSEDYGKYIDVYQTPAQHQKTITGFGLQSSFLDKKIQTVLAYKLYERGTDGYSTYGKSIFKRNSIVNSNDKGFMAGISVKPFKSLLVKASYENTTRMPDDFEVFGFLPWYIASKFDIENENSINYNIQAQLTRPKWMLSASYFFREVSNKIYLKPDIPFSYHTNLPEAFGILAHGFEMDVSVKPFSFMDIGINAMYLDKRQKILNLFGLPLEVKLGINKKIRFIDHPPLLANADMSLYWNNIFKKGDRIDFYWYWNYIHRYDPHIFSISEREIFDEEKNELNGVYGGDLDTHSAGVGYTFANPKISMSFETRNIGDKIYYVSKASGPRRSFYLKVRWQPKL